MAAFLGMLGAGLIGPVLGMIPSAPGGPANPFTGTSAGDPITPLLGLGAGLLGGGSSSGGGTTPLTPVTPAGPSYLPNPTPSPASPNGNYYVAGGGTSTVVVDLMKSPGVWAVGAVLLLLLLRK